MQSTEKQQLRLKKKLYTPRSHTQAVAALFNNISQLPACASYLDLAGSLNVVDGVESLLHRLSQSHNTMISQHQDLNIDIHVE